jgi:hypothetical protein
MCAMAQEFMTRRQVAAYLTEHGLPIGKGQLDKLCWRGEGPPCAGDWGNRKLYRPDVALDWALKRLNGGAS